MATPATTELSKNALAGRLVVSGSGWVLLEVPNALVRGAFDAMWSPGIELPRGGENDRFNAHISVIRKEEVDRLGGPQAISEVGKQFRYRLGLLHEFRPMGWDGVDRCWAFKVISPELQKLRASYGLSPLPQKNGKTLDFHITVAIRRKGVLGRSSISKNTN